MSEKSKCCSCVHKTDFDPRFGYWGCNHSGIECKNYSMYKGIEYGDQNFERRGVVVWTMKMPRSCIGCQMQWGGTCYVAPKHVDDTVVSQNVECKGRPEWCPLDYAEDVFMKHYRQGRKDERAIQNGTLMQTFSPD